MDAEAADMVVGAVEVEVVFKDTSTRHSCKAKVGAVVNMDPTVQGNGIERTIVVKFVEISL